jgi:uncharacterized repeat protein (TIGR01451 family)
MLVGTFNGTLPISSYTAEVDFGAGGPGPLPATISQVGPGAFDVFESNTFPADENSYPSFLIVIEPGPGGQFVNQADFTVTVGEADVLGADSPAAQSVPELTQFSGQVATFQDAFAGTPATDFTATINWGDGVVTAGTVGGSGGTAYTVSGSHAYGDEGTFIATATLTDDSPGTATATANPATTFTVTESDAFTPNAQTLSATEGTAFNGQVASFTDTGNLENVSTDFTATINWGDGVTTAGVVGGGGGSPYTVSGTHTYADEGTFTATATITDDSPGSATSSALSTINVGEADSPINVIVHPPTATEGTAIPSGIIASFSTPYTGNGAGDFTASVSWGDGVTDTGLTPVATGPGAYNVIDGPHTYIDECSCQVTVSVADDSPGTATGSGTASATIGEADTFTNTPSAITATEGTSFSGTVGTFTTTYTGNVASDFTATITWGDSTTTTGTITGGSGSFTVTGTHTYADSGAFITTVAINDDAPGTASNGAAGSATVSDSTSMGIQKTAPSSVQPGQNLTYTITLTNNGPSDIDVADAPTMTDALPAGLTFVSISPSGGPTWNCGSLTSGQNGTETCTATSDFASGASTVFTLVVTVPPATPGGTVFANTATGTSNITTTVQATATTTVSSCTATNNVTGQQPGSVNASSGSWCIVNATIPGSLTVGSGATVTVLNSTIAGGISSSGAGSLKVCGTSAGSGVSVSNSTGFVVLGDPIDDNCAGNTFHGSVSVTSNHAGVELGSNTITAGLTVISNHGASGEDLHPEVEANHIGSSLICPGNSPAAINDGHPNTVGGTRTGDCSAAGF